MPQIVGNARLRTEVVNDGIIATHMRCLLRHSLQHILKLAKVLTFTRRSALDEPPPRFRIGQTGFGDTIEYIVLGLYRDDGTVRTALEICLSVVFGWIFVSFLLLDLLIGDGPYPLR